MGTSFLPAHIPTTHAPAPALHDRGGGVVRFTGRIGGRDSWRSKTPEDVFAAREG